jgi:hypothetical protein
MRLEFEGWRGPCKTTVAVDLDGDVVVYAGVTVKCFDPGFHRVDVSCQAREDYDELVAECFNRVLDLASQLLKSIEDFKIRHCRDLLDCVVVDSYSSTGEKRLS